MLDCELRQVHEVETRHLFKAESHWTYFHRHGCRLVKDWLDVGIKVLVESRETPKNDGLSMLLQMHRVCKKSNEDERQGWPPKDDRDGSFGRAPNLCEHVSFIIYEIGSHSCPKREPGSTRKLR